MEDRLRVLHICKECASNCILDSTTWPKNYLNGQLCTGSKWEKIAIPKHETVSKWEK